MNKNIKRERIYKHTHLNQKDADRLIPLFESAFSSEFKGMDSRPEIKKERMRFVTEQFANRSRIAKSLGQHPLFEDASIFKSALGDNVKQLFEADYSVPQNVIGMGNVTNPMEGNAVPGGMWNPGYEAGSGDIPSYVFGLQSQIALNCIAFDLIPVISVDTPKVTVIYIDSVYGGGTLDNPVDMPSYVEVKSKMFNRTFVKTKALKRATTEIDFVTSTNAVLRVRFILASTISTAITVEVLGTGTTDGTTVTIDNQQSIKTIVDLLNAAEYKVLIDGNEETSTDVISVGYASATRTNIAEATTNNNTLGGMSRAQMEKGPSHKINIIAMDKQTEMVGIEIDADTSNIQIKDMAAMGVNVITELYTSVQNTVVQTLDEIVLKHLYQLGVEHAVNAYESQGLNFSLYISAPTKTEIAMTDIDVVFENMLGEDCKARMGTIKNPIISSSYENQATHADRLYARILLILEFIAKQNRIAPPDYMVTSGVIGSCLKKNSKYTINPSTNTLTQAPELVYSGTIFDTVQVYSNNKNEFNDPRILFGRRGSDNDPGAKFLAYDLAASRQIVAEGTMAEKIRVWSRFQIIDIGFYPELNYYTGVFINDFNWS